ncbi:MAG: DNA primase [SAR324 cluster bacterium]|nr:DNA primase [SAR324 cluster bacterium]
MGLSRETIEEVKDRADILQVIGERVTLRSAGANFKGLCPFHSEKSPSFMVNPGKGIYHCFGCGAGGSVIDFLMAYDRLSFPEAVTALAERFGVTVGVGSAHPARSRELEVLNTVRGWFHENLLRRPEAESARRYLVQRSFDEDSWSAFSLGFALDGWQGLVTFARDQRISLDDLVACGLVKKGPTGRPFDMLRNRVVFPILDAQGTCIGFGGRVIRPLDSPKYLNTPETRHYRKSRVLFGLAQAREALRQAGRVILVEGYLDVMRLHEAGFREAVATCGTALTGDHLDLLDKFTDRVVLVFDGDEAGTKAALRSAPLFLNRGIEARVVTLPADEDPDDFVLKQGAEAFAARLETATPILEHLVFQTLQRHGEGVEGRERAMGELVPLISEIRRPATRDITVRHLADLMKVSAQAINAMLLTARKSPPQADTDTPPAALRSPEGRHQRMLVKILLQERALIGMARELVTPEELADGRMRQLYEKLLGVADDEFKSLAFEDLTSMFPESAADLRAIQIEDSHHTRAVVDWEEVLRNEVFQIKNARINQLLQRIKSARGDEEANQTLQELKAFRRDIAAWKHKRISLGARPSS